ncbi:hypothetical protein ABPG73_018748 [Tetrahymena malaccensis]
MKLSHYFQLNLILFSFLKIASAAISCASIITGLNLKNTKCLLEIVNTVQLTNNVNIKLPNNCNQNIHKSYFDALGGSDCDFSQPIVIKYTENTSSYIGQVFVQSYQWYLQACPQSLQTSLSVNSAKQKQLILNNNSDEFNSIPMCDFRNEIMQIDNVNSQSIEIDYILNQTSSTGLNCLEYLVVVIQTCPQNCSSCDSSLNCQTCIDTFYLYSDKTYGYSLKNNKCEQIYISYGSKSFGQQQVKYLEQNMSKTSSYSYIGTSFVSILQNILFKQSQAILISGFIYQKFSFILILETVLPQPVYISITSLKGKVFS